MRRALHHRAKVSDIEVAGMRWLRERLGMSYRRIGQRYNNTSMWTVRDIVDYRTRKA